jgi:type I restriction enzyme, S subunit
VSALRTERPLGELCEFQRGLTYGKSDEVALSENVVLRANNIDLATNNLDFSELRYIAPSVQVPESKRVRAGSLLICTASGSKSHLGKVAYVDADYGYAFGGFMGQLVPAKGVEGRYLFHALTSPSYKSFIDELSDGLNINNLKFDDLRRFRIPVPAVEVQRRIVAILDEAIEGIATAKVHAERNLRSAREVFDDYLASVFSDHNVGWESAPIEQHVRFIDYRGRTPEKTSEGVRLITAKNLKRGFVQREPMEFVAPDSYDEWMTRGIPKLGDVLFTTEAPLGHVAQLDTDERVVFAQRVIIMQADSKVLDSAFFKYLLLSAPVQAKIRAQATGATAQGIKASLLKRIEIPFPSDVAEQRLIASRLDVLAEDSSQLEDLYQRKLAALDELKQSLLHQAFSGAL